MGKQSLGSESPASGGATESHFDCATLNATVLSPLRGLANSNIRDPRAALRLPWATFCRPDGLEGRRATRRRSLLTDAELAEDSIEDVVRVDDAQDLAEVVEGITQVECDDLVARFTHGGVSRGGQ